MTTINAYIGFNGNCREAMNFYKQCLGGELTLMPVEGSPAEAHCPESMKNGIMHASLVNNSMVIMGTDMTGPEGFQSGSNISLSVNCSSEEEIHRFFNNLSEGGTVMEPVKDQFWGALFGFLKDKYGQHWMLNYDKNQNK